MAMNGRDNTITKEWVQQQYSAYHIDPILLEKAAYCLELVSCLVDSDLDFIFKGGTSLLLILPEPRRLSIDVDIASDCAKEDIEDILNNMIPNNHFIGYEEDVREGDRHDMIPKAHFKIYFNSEVSGNQTSILLDIVFQETHYAEEMRSIVCPFYNPNSQNNVRVPTVSSLLGDKLVALAPTTTGVSYGSGKELQRIKQLFDCGCLFELMGDDFSHLMDAFNKCIIQENGFFHKEYDINHVVDDIIDFARLVCSFNLRGFEANERTGEIKSGIDSFPSYLIGHRNRYSHVGHAKVDAARVAFISSLIKHIKDYEDAVEILNTVRYYAESDIEKSKEIFTDITFPGGFGFISGLIKQNPKAACYWCGCIRPNLFSRGQKYGESPRS